MTEVERLRHSTAHVLATAIAKIWPEAQLRPWQHFRLGSKPKTLHICTNLSETVEHRARKQMQK